MALPDIAERLVMHLKSKGMSKEKAIETAISHLQKSGVLRKGTTQLTDKGVSRNNMTPAQREKERSVGATERKTKAAKSTPAVIVNNVKRTRKMR